jgi:hypothetical protein
MGRDGFRTPKGLGFFGEKGCGALGIEICPLSYPQAKAAISGGDVIFPLALSHRIP